MRCLPNLLARLDLSLFAWIFLSLCPWSWIAWAKVASVGLLLCVCWHCSDSPWAMAWKMLLQPVAKDGNSLLASSKQSGALFLVGVPHLMCASKMSSSLQGAGTLHDQPWALVSQTHWNFQEFPGGGLLAYAPSNQHGSCSWPRSRQVGWDQMQGLAFWRSCQPSAPGCTYVHFAPPCGTASRARFIKRRGRHNPPVLRTDDHPNGLPHLSPLHAAKVAAANLLYSNSSFVPLVCWTWSALFNWISSP